jgi:hypothetical protein
MFMHMTINNLRNHNVRSWKISCDDYVPNEQVPDNNHNNPQVRVNVVNIDNFSKVTNHVN